MYVHVYKKLEEDVMNQIIVEIGIQANAILTVRIFK